jgi:hypothetical protein
MKWKRNAWVDRVISEKHLKDVVCKNQAAKRPNDYFTYLHQ